MVYCTTSRTPEESAFHPAVGCKKQERHNKMNMMECPITQKQPGEKRADSDKVLANEQPFGRMGRREANASAAHSLPPMKILS
jgi:hypothetical protein